MPKPLCPHIRFLAVITAVIVPVLSSPSPAQTRLRVLFTNDLHSTLTPVAVNAADGHRVQSGGFARLASALRGAASVNPEGTVIVDAGDFTMGTVYSMLYLTESPELRLMGAMGYDVVTLGNHDFDFSFDGLARYLTNARTKGGPLPTIVLSNLDISADSRSNDSLRRAFEEYGVGRFSIVERKGARVGVFGLMGENAANTALIPESARFEDAGAAARRMVRLLRDSAKAQMVVCLSHSGTSEVGNGGEDIRLANAVPGIDIIVSGHTHRTLRDPLVVGSTIIVSAGACGSHLGILDMQLLPAAPARLVHYELMPVDSTLTADSAIARSMRTYEELVDSQLTLLCGIPQHQVIARSGFNFETVESHYEHPRETALGDLIGDAYRYAATRAGKSNEPPIDAALVPIGMIRGTLLSGPITVADVFNVLSLGLGPDREPGYPLIAFYVTGRDLLNALETETTLSSINEDAHLQVAGIHFRYNPYRVPLNRVAEAEIVDSEGNPHPIADESLYHVCMCLYSGIKLTFVSSLSHGLITIQPRRRDGTVITDLNETLVDADGTKPGTQELKAWIALLEYLQSFASPHDSNPPSIPERYRLPAGRFEARSSMNPVDLIRKPNRITVTAAVLVLTLLCVMTWVIQKIVARRRRDVR